MKGSIIIKIIRRRGNETANNGIMAAAKKKIEENMKAWRRNKYQQ